MRASKVLIYAAMMLTSLALILFATAGPLTSQPYYDAYSGADLLPILQSAKEGRQINCEPGGIFRISSTASIKAQHIRLNLNGSELSLPTGGHTGIWCWSNDFILSNAKVISGGVVMRSNGHDNGIANCTLDNCDQIAVTDAGDMGFLFDNNKVGMTNGCGLYLCGPHFFVRNSTFAGSRGEYDIRTESPMLMPGQLGKGNQWTGGLISGCVITNHNQWGKDAVGFRWGSGIRMTNCKIFGSSVRYGAVAPPGAVPITKADQINGAMVLDHCEFFGTPDGGAAVRVYQGTTLDAMDNTFHVTIPGLPFGVDSPSVLTLARNTILYPAGSKSQLLVGKSSPGTYTPAGKDGTIWHIDGSPATRPATQPAR